jgi:biopolymer transport protein ExbB
VNTWHHLAVVSSAADIKIYLDGESYATLAAKVPALNTQALLGRDGTPGATDAEGEPGFAGDLDELQISKMARPPALFKLDSVTQAGGEKAAKVLTIGADEASAKASENEITKHLSLLSDISKSLTPGRLGGHFPMYSSRLHRGSGRHPQAPLSHAD